MNKMMKLLKKVTSIVVAVALGMGAMPALPAKAATDEAKQQFRNMVIEMLETGDGAERNVRELNLTFDDYYDIFWDVVANECIVSYRCYVNQVPRTTKDGQYIKTFWLHNSDAGFMERYIKTKETINEIQAGLQDGMSELDKVLYIHDYIVRNTYYKIDTEGFSAIAAGPLALGYAKCNGYAEAMELLLKLEGIEADILYDKVQNHCWIIINIDGEWYHIDPTWDDTRSSIKGEVSHNFFLRNDDEFKNAPTNAHSEWSGEISTSEKYEDWYIHDIVGDMFYDNGYWYYEEQGAIVRNDIEGNQYAVVVDGSNLQIKSLTGGVLSYTDGQENYEIQVAGCESDQVTAIPTAIPTEVPTEAPTATPTEVPTATPTEEPTATPTEVPATTPTEVPTATPTEAPTATPTEAPTATPTEVPTATPTEVPTATPTEEPTATPTEVPATTPTEVPTATPTEAPTATPTEAPTEEPTATPTATPTEAPTATPTEAPTATPTATPTKAPTVTPVLTAKEQFRNMVIEMLETGDGSERNIRELNLTFDDYNPIFWDVVANECMVSYRCYVNQVPRTTKDGKYIETFWLYNSDAGFMERYTKTKETISKIQSGIQNEMSELEKVLYIHDYIVKNTYYKKDAEGYSAIAAGPLALGYGKCNGYMEAMDLLLKLEGIESDVVFDKAVTHCWIIVKIDGEWYHIDPTWDDTRSDVDGEVSHNFFIRNDNEFRYDPTNPHNEWKGEISVSKKYEDWYVHDIVGDMFYDNGYWYYQEEGAIVRNDIEGNQYAVVVAGNDLKIKNLSNGILTYTDGTEIYTVDVAETRMVEASVTQAQVTTESAVSAIPAIASEAEQEKTISNHKKYVSENIKEENNDTYKMKMNNAEDIDLKQVESKKVSKEKGIYLKQGTDCNSGKVTSGKENVNNVVNENKTTLSGNKFGVQDELVIGSARGMLYYFRMLQQN